MFLPECQSSTHLRLKQNEVPQTLCKLENDCTRCPRRRNFFFFSFLKNKSNRRSTSKLCVSAGPEPSGPEPVLLQVFSICQPRVRSPLSEDPSITAEREAAFSCLNRATSREAFRDQVETFFVLGFSSDRTTSLCY